MCQSANQRSAVTMRPASTVKIAGTSVNPPRVDEEILGAALARKGRAEGKLFQLIQPNLLPRDDEHYPQVPVHVTFIYVQVGHCIGPGLCVTICPMRHCSPKYSSETKGTSRSSPLIRSILSNIYNVVSSHIEINTRRHSQLPV